MTFDHPRGSTFLLTVTCPFVITGATITSQVRGLPREQLIADLVSTEVDEHTFTLEGGDTSAWPIGPAIWDIRIERVGVIQYTDLVTFKILQTSTRS